MPDLFGGPAFFVEADLAKSQARGGWSGSH